MAACKITQRDQCSLIHKQLTLKVTRYQLKNLGMHIHIVQYELKLSDSIQYL